MTPEETANLVFTAVHIANEAKDAEIADLRELVRLLLKALTVAPPGEAERIFALKRKLGL